MSYDRKGQRYCDGCGRLIVKAHRQHHDDDYCSICYPRLFLRCPCRVCGELARFHQNAPYVERVCGTCERAQRKCLRCDKPLPRAAKRVAGGFVCAACVIYFAEKKPCSQCGRLSPRLSRAPGFGVNEPICDRCRNRLTHRTCSVCHRYRPSAGEFPDGRPYCAACAPGISATHVCPACGTTVPGAGQGRCLVCLNKERVTREIRLQELALSKAWTREFYAGFGEWLVKVRPSHRRLLAVLARHFAFFQALDVVCDSLEEVSGDLLLRCFGVAGLRAHTFPMRYLGACRGIEIGDDEKAAFTELHRMSVILKESQAKSWGMVIVRYGRWLESKKIAVRTRRGYLSAATRFCHAASIKEDGLYTADQIRHFLQRYPGLRASLYSWNSFAAEALGCAVSMPAARQRRSRPKTVRDLAKLLSRINDSGPDSAPVRILQRTIAKAFGYSVARFGLYKWSTEEQKGKVWLCREGERLPIPGRLVPIVVSWKRRMRAGSSQPSD